METGQYSEYNSGYIDGYNQAQSYRKAKDGVTVALDFDDSKLDSTIAKAERLKKILIECRDLAEGLTVSTCEMPFDEFVKKLSLVYSRVSKRRLNGEIRQGV